MGMSIRKFRHRSYDNVFLELNDNRLVILVTFDSKGKEIIKRTCIPFVYGPSMKYKDGLDRYHFFTWLVPMVSIIYQSNPNKLQKWH